MAKDSKIQSIEGVFFCFGGGVAVSVSEFFRDLDLVFSFRHLRLTWFRFCVSGKVNW